MVEAKRRRADFLPTRKQFFWYFTLPMSVQVVLQAMFFSGVRLFENIVAASHFETVHWNARREFGLLENLQHLILLAVVVIAVRAAIRHEKRFVKAFMAFVAFGAVFLFLEEIDYGLHYYELWKDVPFDKIAEVRNIHNIGRTTLIMKNVADTGMILLFGIVPFAMARNSHPWVRYFRPEPAMALLLIVGLITRMLARFLHRQMGLGHGLGLDGNLSEFRELIMYYHGLVYTLYLARRCPDSLRPASGSH